MAETITRRMTFEEFIQLPEDDCGYELVNGRLEPLAAPTMRHGSIQATLAWYLKSYLGKDFRGTLAAEVDIPTVPFHGRRPDIIYVAPEHLTPEDWDRGYPLHPPDLVVEVVSPADAGRDYIVKRQEYAAAGIAHYWIIDPAKRSADLLRLDPDGSYIVERHLEQGGILTTELFPGLSIPMADIFREGSGGGPASDSPAV
ncbi:MAG: Uma2 family endonuclease [Chloroflexi bacterium]|nr:Uma2 family endonuclease [Chloroflexota bacterium]